MYPVLHLYQPALNVAPPQRLRRQQGVALAMVMMVTLVIVALSVSLAIGIFGERRLSRNTADLALARQGAEAALRDAERDLNCEKWDATANTYVSWYGDSNPANPRAHCIEKAQICSQIGDLGAQVVLNDAGQVVVGECVLGMRSAPLANASGELPALTSLEACSVRLGQITGEPALTGTVVPGQPRYRIEVFNLQKQGGKSSVPIYRIHARGYGRSTTPTAVTPSPTSVDLEAIISPCN